MRTELIKELEQKIAKQESLDKWPAMRNPVGDSVLLRAGQLLGFPLPALLSEIYMFIGNGGFGPGDSSSILDGILLSVHDGSKGFLFIEDCYINLSQSNPRNPLWRWPKALLPFCSWGGGMYSCVDCTSEGLPIFFFDSNYVPSGQPYSPILLFHKPSLYSWIDAWVKGVDLGAEIIQLERPLLPESISNHSHEDF